VCVSLREIEQANRVSSCEPTPPFGLGRNFECAVVTMKKRRSERMEIKDCPSFVGTYKERIATEFSVAPTRQTVPWCALTKCSLSNTGLKTAFVAVQNSCSALPVGTCELM
jgi:hypothetical protein